MEIISGNAQTETMRAHTQRTHPLGPPPPPESIGVTKTNATESMTTLNSENMLKNMVSVPLPNYDDSNNLDLNNFKNNYGDTQTNEEYYKKMIPSY
jgi:hypothetical protein